jgi:hypothetical protein
MKRSSAVGSVDNDWTAAQQKYWVSTGTGTLVTFDN